MTSLPTVRQQQVHDAVERLGDTTVAALELGVSRVTVEVTLAHYHQKVCLPRVVALEGRIAELEQELADALQAPRRVVFIDHRRVVDGGRTKREQMREARSA